MLHNFEKVSSFYQSPLTCLPSLGAEKAEVMKDEMGCVTIEDLLYYFPRRYLDRTITEEENLSIGEEVTFVVQIKSVYLHHTGRSSRLIAQAQSLQGSKIEMIWFRGAKYLRFSVKKGSLLIVSGKLTFFRGLQMTHPDFEILDSAEDKNLIHTGRIIPLYPSNDLLKKKNIESRTLRRFIKSAICMGDSLENMRAEELIPLELMNKYKLMNRYDALSTMHFPNSLEELDAARFRLKYEELYFFQLLMYHKSLYYQKVPRKLKPKAMGTCVLYKNLLNELPFSLTRSQEQAILYMVNACQKEKANAFLLQGDVGSGKTLVALSIALHYIELGIQIVFIAPTEILAYQHFFTISQFLGMKQSHRIELVTGSDKKKERLQKLEYIANGDVGIIIGTHSLLEESVQFKELGLVVIDEQQRFGVKQRELIRSKGKNPDTIAMSATPIPRSLCMTEFADLDLVMLKEKPLGRKDIETIWMSSRRRNGIYNSIRKYVNLGKQAYIVYPLIQESENMDLEAATEAYENLHKVIFSEFSVSLLHGRMKRKEKESVMQKFHQGKVQILVSTSVIEVGVDVPNATIIVIEHAERFGLSQLHQLRGRVGRGQEKSYCILVSDANGADTKERLQALVDSEDGFYLAEMDLKIRGTGELMGLKQHGISELRLANLISREDQKLSKMAYEDARTIAKLTPAGQKFLCKRFSHTPEWVLWH